MKSVYVGNLPYATTEDELKALFAPFGEVLGARIKTDRDTGRPLGYGFVQMEDADTEKAIQGLDGKEYQGRNLRVNESRDRNDRPQRDGEFRPRRDFNGPREGGEFRPRRDSGFRSDRPSFNRGPRPERHFDGDHPRRDGEFHPRRSFNGPREGGEFRPRRDFGPREEFHPREEFRPREEYSDDDAGDYMNTPSGDFGGEDFGRERPRRRDFKKDFHNRGRRDFRDGDRQGGGRPKPRVRRSNNRFFDQDDDE